MADPTHKTKGIVLRSVKYGETSLIVTIFTELFGIQSYMVNGVRTSSKKGTGKVGLFQPAVILDMVVYHNELKHLNRIKEFKCSAIYQHILSEVPKNAAALFMIELLTKCLKQPDTNTDLFYFTEDCLLELDKCNSAIAANLPLFYALHLPYHFGFRITDNYTSEANYLDLKEGIFVQQQPDHPAFLDAKQAITVSTLLKVLQPKDLSDIKLNHDFRRQLLHQLETFYSLHIESFGTMKTLQVLREVMR